MGVIQKMQMFEVDWYKVMEDVRDNYDSMYWTGRGQLVKIDLFFKSGFDRLVNCTRVFMRCMLKWCVKEDGTINREFVDILTDVETHMADVTRFILQHAGDADSFDGKDFSNIDHLLPRMANACLHVLAADNSPPNFDISQDSLEDYVYYLKCGSWECQGFVRENTSSQIEKAIDLTKFVITIGDKVNNGKGRDLLICLESFYDKVACHVFLGCWETYYDMYPSAPNTNIDTLFLAGMRKLTALHLDLRPVATWTDEILEAYVGYGQKMLTQLQNGTDLTRPVKDQLENLRRGLVIIIKVHSCFPRQLQGTNLVDVGVEVQALVGCIESIVFSSFTTQAENLNVVVASAAENISLHLQNFLSSIIKDRVMHLTSCMPVPLTHEFLIELVGRVQRFICEMLEDENIIQVNPQRYYEELGETVDVMDATVEVQTMARNIESFIYSFFSRTEDIELVVAASVAKINHGLRNFSHLFLKAWMLQLTSLTTLPLTDKLLIQFMEYVQQFMSQILKDKKIIPTPVKYQVECIYSELGNLVNFHSNYPLELYTDEGPNLVDVRTEVQVLARNIAHFMYSTFIIQIKENSIDAAATAKIRLGVRSLLASVLKTWILQLTSCKTLPLTDEGLLQFMECVQRFLCVMSKDENITRTSSVSVQLELLHYELGILVQFHISYRPQLNAEEGSNLDAVRMVVQTVLWNIATFIYSSLITETKLDAANVISGLHNLLTSILRAWTVQLTVNNALPLVDELLIQFKVRVQQVMSGALKDENTELAVAETHLLQIQDDSMGFLLHNIFRFKPNHRPEEETPCNITSHQMRSIASNMKKFTEKQIKDLGPTMSFSLSDLVEKFTHLKSQVMDTIFLTLVCRLRRVDPNGDQLSFLSFLIHNMEQLVSGGSDLIGKWMDEIQTIYGALLIFRDFLQSLADSRIAHLQDICDRVVNVAYEAEYLIYSFYNVSYPASCIALWISHFVQEVELTKACVLDTFEKNKTDGGISIHDSVEDQNKVSSETLIPIIDLVVGFEVEMQHVKQQLVSSQHLKALDVVSIIGMPGLGKTTLARKVYEDRQISNHFQIRAWCCVSNEYSKKELLFTILGCIVEHPDAIQNKNQAELSTLLHKQLKRRRYLIVLDDVWEIGAFEFLKLYLPDDKNGSRIMLTSRNRVIGKKAKHHSDLLELRMLTDEESWLLLSKKVYRDEKCPPEFCQVGKRIAESCRGLPLAIVVVAGLLAKSIKTREFWEQVAENLSSYISHDSQEQGMAVLELSYKHLPRHLKPLFLYIGAFPQDREVQIENLIWLWIAEGFVKDNMTGSLEHQAELYLLDLIDRSFLMVSARRSDGRVKTCIIHDLLHDMCLLKAKEEHVLQQINVSDDLPDPISYQKRLSILLQRRKEVTPTNLISDGAPTNPFIVCEDLSTLSLSPPLYTFLFFNKNKSLPLWREAVVSVLRDLRLLRVLHIESTSIDDNLCGDVMMLVRLRYISVRAAWYSIPSVISKLQNLETLVIKGLRGEIVVPNEIWELVKLRHVHINDRAKFSEPSSKSSMLENLETLSTPAIRDGDEEKLMRRVPNVRKVRCIFLESCPQLKSPNQLESLKAIYTGTGRCPGSFVVPLTLKKLSLSKFCLKWAQVSAFQKLPELEILNLRIGAVGGDSWNMDEEGEFIKLKVLKLESLNIKRWTACTYNFPRLEKLVLKKCKQLMEIPSELGEINTLQTMEVLLCSNAAASSAKRIEEEQKDAGNESLEVHIYSPSNMGSSSSE